MPVLAALAGLWVLLQLVPEPDEADELVTDTSASAPPARFTIVPDDYHVPYAGTAEDGRKFFLSEELFGDGGSYVGLFLWRSDGTFDEVRVDPATGSSDGLAEARLAELGDYTLEPITVEPFVEKVGADDFGWLLEDYDGEYALTITPGNFIAYYAPWDGLGYDT